MKAQKKCALLVPKLIELVLVLLVHSATMKHRSNTNITFWHARALNVFHGWEGEQSPSTAMSGKCLQKVTIPQAG